MVEIDSFGYINHNSLQYGVALPGSGIRLIIPRDCNEVKAIAAPHQGREFIANGALENGAFCTVSSENFHKF
jgi:hypothetical protein